MSNTNGLFTDGSDPYAPRANSIPLTDSDAYTAENGSIGDLVSDATAQMSSLVRAEVELAKAEIATEVKRVSGAAACSAWLALLRCIAHSSFSSSSRRC